MAFLIRISPAKGGVGASTVAINLSVALANSAKKILLVDSDAVTPMVSTYLKLPPALGYKELILQNLPVEKAIMKSKKNKIDIITGTSFLTNHNLTRDQILKAAKKVQKLDYDFIIIDTPYSLFHKTAKIFDESLIISTPMRNAIKNCKDLFKLYKPTKMKYRLVINGVNGKSYQMKKKDIEKTCDTKISAMLPEDKVVVESIYQSKPAISINQKAAFCVRIKKLSDLIISDAEESN